MALSEVQKKERSEYLEENLQITECSQMKPYAFISYASDNWETVFKSVVIPMQRQYGLQVYADKAFDKVNDKWIVPMLRNVRGSDVVIAFISQSYIESYACFLELLTAVNNKKQIVFVSLGEKLHLGDTTDLPDVERGVKNEILNQGANIATNTNNTSNDIMRAMKSAYTSLSTLLEQDALSKYDISDAFINFFRDASINRKSINDLGAVRRTIKSVSRNVFDKSLIAGPVHTVQPPVPQPEPVEQPVSQPEPVEQPVSQPEPAEQPVSQPEPAEPPVSQPEPVEQSVPQPEPVEQSVPQPEPQTEPEYQRSEAPDASESQDSSEVKKTNSFQGKKKAGIIAGCAAVILLLIVVFVVGGTKNVTDVAYTLSDGSTGTYTGEWKKNMPEGQGTMKFDEDNEFKRESYEGEWTEGELNGQGTMKWISGAVYEGEFKESKFDGQGTYKWKDGAVYEGEFKEGNRNGQGTMKFDEDDEEGRESYEGEWMDDKPGGQGTMKWKNGNVYAGEWKEGNRDGQGVITYGADDESGRESYEGEWKEGKRAGQGTLKWTDGTVYEGEYKDDVINGQGTMRWPDGSFYKGEYKDGKRGGQGVYTYAEDDEYGRDYYEGEWKEDKRDGQGTLKWKNGAVFEGEWKEDSRDGQGTHKDADGNVTTGIWNGDEFLGAAFGAPGDLTAVINPDNSEGVKVEWAAVYGATGYQTCIFKDAEHKEVWVDGGVGQGTNITWGSLADGSTYYFGVRAVKEENGSATYSDWSYVTYTHNP